MNDFIGKTSRIAMMVTVGVLGSLPASCNQNPGLGGTVVDVSLAEFTVTPEINAAPAGLITFRVRNGGSVTHEFLVIRTDLAPDALPSEQNGAYQENGAGTELIDEVEGITSGRTSNLSVTLEAGNYVLICNMVAIVNGEPIAHYAQGMATSFTVTASGAGDEQ